MISAARATRVARKPRVWNPAKRILLPGIVTGYVSAIVLLPLAALLWRSTNGGWARFWQTVLESDTVAALQLTIAISLAVAVVNAVSGTIIAWVLVRDQFPSKRLMNSVIDLPFALPTIVAGLTLLALYGPASPVGVDVAYTRAGVLVALLFVTLPFVVRSVQPVLMEVDREMEDAAASLGANSWIIFQRIVLPSILPAILSGMTLAFARAMGEFGAVVLISGNIPFQTEVASVHIYSQIQSDNEAGAAAISVVLLFVSLLTLLLIAAIERLGALHAE